MNYKPFVIRKINYPRVVINTEVNKFICFFSKVKYY